MTSMKSKCWKICKLMFHSLPVFGDKIVENNNEDFFNKFWQNAFLRLVIKSVHFIDAY